MRSRRKADRRPDPTAPEPASPQVMRVVPPAPGAASVPVPASSGPASAVPSASASPSDPFWPATTTRQGSGATEPSSAGGSSAPERRLLNGRLGAALRWPRLAWYQEILAVIAGDIVYEVIRASAPQKAAEAFHNAAMLTAMEPDAVRAAEAWLRHLTNTQPWLNQIFGAFYALMHLSVTVGVLVWLWWRRPLQYARARTALFALTFGGLLIFWIFPVAPPRLVTPEAINALGTPAISALDGTGGLSGALGTLVNPYAAFPSLHVAWAAWCAWAVWAHLGDHRRRWLAWLYPLATIVVVIGTSNHYVIDVLAGLLVVLLAVAAGGPLSSGTVGNRALTEVGAARKR